MVGDPLGARSVKGLLSLRDIPLSHTFGVRNTGETAAEPVNEKPGRRPAYHSKVPVTAAAEEWEEGNINESQRPGF